MLIDNSGAILAMLDRLVADRVQRVATVLVVEHKKDLAKPFPVASKPGQYPAKRTGNLQQDVVTEPVGKQAYRVGYAGKAPYITRLADTGRETVVTTALRSLNKLRRAAEGK